MIDKEKEAYNFFKKCNEKDLENFFYFSEPSKLQIKYIETVLNLIQTQQEEIEKYKIQLAEVFANTVNSDLKQKHKHEEDLEALHLGWKAELEKKDKIINELAKLIIEDDGSWNMHNIFNEQEAMRILDELATFEYVQIEDGDTAIETIKYYVKKLEEEINDGIQKLERMLEV